MKNYLNDYIDSVEELIKKGTSSDLKKLKEELLIKISFFQHERLIHLLVTLFFALLFILLMILLQYSPIILIAILIVLIVLCFYIIHYYRLENGVQYLYTKYDEILEKLNDKKTN